MWDIAVCFSKRGGETGSSLCWHSYRSRDIAIAQKCGKQWLSSAFLGRCSISRCQTSHGQQYDLQFMKISLLCGCNPHNFSWSGTLTALLCKWLSQVSLLIRFRQWHELQMMLMFQGNKGFQKSSKVFLFKYFNLRYSEW